MAAAYGDEIGNNLLRALRPGDLRILEPLLVPWEAAAGAVIYEPGDHVRTVYFPCGPALCSFMIDLSDGKGVETTLIGREGAVGGIVSQGRLPAYARCVVQFPGTFLTIPSAALEDAKLQSLTLRYLFSRYADCLMAQIFQAVACNAGHTIEQRAAKWLVAAIDRTGDHDVPLTQEQLAGMLGVGRSYISLVIRSLKERAILETRRGGVRVRDLEDLTALACDCNEQVRRHFDDVLRGVYPTAEESTAQKHEAGETRPRARMQG
jgi:CRP-like cAMP-binding protein